MAAKRQSATGLEAEKRFWGPFRRGLTTSVGSMWPNTRHRIQIYERG